MAMKKFINDPADLVKELLEGYCLAYSDKVALQSERLVVRAHPKDPAKVALVTLGGSGHEPALCGYVGEGMLDICAAGDIFAAPGPPKVFEALKAADRPAGTLFIVLNHAGDVLSSNMALKMAQKAGLNVRSILTHEDIAAGADAPLDDRRGLVGALAVWKIAGAAAEAGKSLEEVYALAERVSNNMATLGVALRTATHPGSGHAIFELAEDEMEIGMGQHGEAGTGRSKLKTADQTAEEMVNQLLDALSATKGDRLLMLMNGFGATTHMELFIVMRRVGQVLADKGIELARARVGEYLTVQEMAGFQMFAAKMDDELLHWWDAPCDTPYFTVR